jgi:hypothetical protein
MSFALPDDHERAGPRHRIPRRKRPPNRLLRLIRRFLFGIVLLGLAVLGGLSPVQAQAHSLAVTITCTPDYSQAADVLITNQQDHGTGWMHGYRISATLKSGQVITETNSTVPFRLAARSHIGWIVGFQPHTVVSCTAGILWS